MKRMGKWDAIKHQIKNNPTMKRGRILRLTSDNGVTFIYKITCFSVKLLYVYCTAETYGECDKNFKILYDYKSKN